jgi:hypothetical protein
MKTLRKVSDDQRAGSVTGRGYSSRHYPDNSASCVFLQEQEGDADNRAAYHNRMGSASQETGKFALALFSFSVLVENSRKGYFRPQKKKTGDGDLLNMLSPHWRELHC